MITDACPECEADHMDIQALTFNKVDILESLIRLVSWLECWGNQGHLLVVAPGYVLHKGV